MLGTRAGAYPLGVSRDTRTVQGFPVVVAWLPLTFGGSPAWVGEVS